MYICCAYVLQIGAMERCVYPNCGLRKYSNQETTFFCFPKNEDLKKEWLLVMGLTEIPSSSTTRNYSRVCERHFKESSILRFNHVMSLNDSNRRKNPKLKSNAVPVPFGTTVLVNKDTAQVQQTKETETLPKVLKVEKKIDTNDAHRVTSKSVFTDTKELRHVTTKSVSTDTRDLPTLVSVGVQVDTQSYNSTSTLPSLTETPIVSDLLVSSTPKRKINMSDFSSPMCEEDQSTINNPKDNTYEPSGINSTLELDYSSGDSAKSETTDEVFLVYYDQLKQLLNRCIRCGGLVITDETKRLSNMGSKVKFTFRCINGCSTSWSSQRNFVGGQGVGNIDLVSCILFSGIPYAKFERFASLMNLKIFNESTYYRLRRQYVFPVVRDRYEKEQEKLYAEFSQKELNLIGDGRCDSPGHSAKFCIYTFMEPESQKILESTVISVTEVKNSNAMEKEGFRRLLDKMQLKGIKIKQISTDRHPQIRKHMKVKHPEIDHTVDPWHIIKGLTKKVIAKSKKKSCADLALWVESLRNHFWWSLSNATSREDFVERFNSILNHIVNRHNWPGCSTFTECAHGPIPERTKWMKADSDGYIQLRKLIINMRFQNDLRQIGDALHTTHLEVHHNVISKYLPKLYCFEYEHMEIGNMLAVLENNANAGRKQKRSITKRDGKLVVKSHFRVAYRKPTKKFIARKFYEKKQYNHYFGMIKACRQNVSTKVKCTRPTKRKRMAPATDRPSKNELISTALKYTRF